MLYRDAGSFPASSIMKAIDIRDAVFMAGVVALGVGLYGIDWRLAATGVGGLLIYLGLFHKNRAGE